MKISHEFATRLDSRNQNEMVRAVVMLEFKRTAKGTGRRASRAKRKELTEAARRSVEAVADDIAEILERFGGHRLEREIDTLGSLAIETTPAGIKALTECPQVRAIVEDQPLSLISK